MLQERKRPKPPKGWPANVSYVEKPVHSPALSETQLSVLSRQHLEGNLDSALPVISTTSVPPNFVQIRNISDSSHPAHGQRGLFASRRLEASSLIIVYMGFVHGRDEADPASNHDLWLDKEYGLGVDASAMGNAARFINDYRGIRKEGPNAEFKDCWLERSSSRVGESQVKYYEKCIGVFVLSEGKSGKRKAGIAKNEEIVVSYGKGFWLERTLAGETKYSAEIA